MTKIASTRPAPGPVVTPPSAMTPSATTAATPRSAAGDSYSNVHKSGTAERSTTSAASVLGKDKRSLLQQISKHYSNTIGAADPGFSQGHTGIPIAWDKTTPVELYGAAGPTGADVRQGALGDCYLLAALAVLAEHNPSAIRNLVRDNGDGTYAVSFFWESPPGSGKFRPERVIVDGDLPRLTQDHGNMKQGQEIYARTSDADGDGLREVWVPIVEKAYALYIERRAQEFHAQVVPYLPAGKRLNDLPPEKAREIILKLQDKLNLPSSSIMQFYWGKDMPKVHAPPQGTGYDGLHGAWLRVGLETLTGRPAVEQVVDSLSKPALLEILRQANAGVPVTVATGTTALEGTAPTHAYSVLAVSEDPTGTWITLRNPWGQFEPGDPQGDGVFRLELDQLHQHFWLVAHVPGYEGPLRAQVKAQGVGAPLRV